jgi:hypothetical protein
VQNLNKMWIRNKRTGEYECLSPAVAKHKIHHDNTKSWEDTQSQYCSCGAVNHREKTHCRSCGKALAK